MTGSDAVDRLIDLGFSQYEAQTYLGLLGKEPMTGYALSNSTGVPQPKVYETLRRLARKGVAVPVGGEPTRYVALPPAQVLSHLDASFRQRLADAQIELTRAVPDSDAPEVRVLRSLSSWEAIVSCTIDLLANAERYVDISVNCDRSDEIFSAITAADERGVQVNLLHFGGADLDLDLDHGRSLRHLSTDGVIYRHHQARHIGLVVDGIKALWSLAADGHYWQAVTSDDYLLAAVVKGYIRHDIYIQQIVEDFGELMEGRYGPGLGLLVTPAGGPATVEPVLKKSRPRRSA